MVNFVSKQPSYIVFAFNVCLSVCLFGHSEFIQQFQFPLKSDNNFDYALQNAK